MLELGYATTQDKAEIIRLWQEAFGDDEPYTSWYFANIYQKERTFCLYGDEKKPGKKPISVIQFAPYSLFLHGESIDVCYLVGVCTDSRYQGQGYAAKLMRYAINELSSRFRLIMLYTDIPAFYQPFGFSHCYGQQTINIPAAPSADIPHIWQRSSLIPADIASCQRIYQQMTSELNGYILRSEDNWRNYLADFLCGEGRLYLKDDAYLLWFVDEDRIAKIKEIGYSSQAALGEALDLAAHIAKSNGLAQISWQAPLSAPCAKGDIVPHVMARDCTAQGSAQEIIAATQKLFGESQNLWVNEIT